MTLNRRERILAGLVIGLFIVAGTWAGVFSLTERWQTITRKLAARQRELAAIRAAIEHLGAGGHFGTLDRNMFADAPQALQPCVIRAGSDDRVLAEQGNDAHDPRLGGLAEIAEATDIPLGTAKSRLHHALTALREDRRAKEFFEE